MTALGPASVVVVGSLHYEIAVTVLDLPRAGETLAGHAWRAAVGGRGADQARAAARAGAKVAMIGAVGRDDLGSALLAALDAAGVDRSGIAELDGSSSDLRIDFSAATGNLGAVVVGAATAALDEAAIAARGAAIDDARILVLQDELPHGASLAAAARSRSTGCITIFSGVPDLEACAALADLIDLLVIDASEADRLGGGSVSSRREALAAAVLLLDRFGAVVVTAARAGLAYADRIGTRITLETPVRQAIASRGCGDIFVGTLAAALARESTMNDALQAAGVAAASVFGPSGDD